MGLDKYSSLKLGTAEGKEITDAVMRKQQSQKRTSEKEVESWGALNREGHDQTVNSNWWPCSPCPSANSNGHKEVADSEIRRGNWGAENPKAIAGTLSNVWCPDTEWSHLLLPARGPPFVWGQTQFLKMKFHQQDTSGFFCNFECKLEDIGKNWLPNWSSCPNF